MHGFPMNRPDDNLSIFAEHLRLANPFDENRVTQIDSLVGDIPQINNSAFEQLKLHAQKTAMAANGRGVVVSGSPGIGKSHLLARFGQWARAEKYPFVYLLNLQAGPDDILRTILRTTISILSRNFAMTPWHSRLYKIVSMAVKEAIQKSGTDETPDLNQARRFYRRMLAEHNLQGDVYEVLWTLFEDVQRIVMQLPRTNLAPLSLKWLSGGSLDPDQAGQLGLNMAGANEEGSGLSLEDMKNVLRVLCQFSAFRNRSFILCFDQVDTLSEDQVQTWSSTVHALLDLCPGLLVVTSGVDETFLKWTAKALVSKASWDDRIRQFPVLLSGISAPAARELILSRLKNSCLPFESIPEVGALRAHDVCFPLGKAAVDPILLESDGTERNDMRPRDVISRAGTAWDRQVSKIQSQGFAAWLHSWNQIAEISTAKMSDNASEHDSETSTDSSPEELIRRKDAVIARKLVEHQRAREQRPEELPVDAGNLTGLLTSLLTACTQAPATYRDAAYRHLLGFETAENHGPSKPAFQLVVEQIEPHAGVRRRIGVAVAESTSGLSATNMLKRIQASLLEGHIVDEAVLILDGRAPLNLATAGKERLKELTAMESKFSITQLSFSDYAALDALESVAGLTRAGDLTYPGENGRDATISDTEVYESHHRLGRYLNSPVIGRLIGHTESTTAADVA